jgi:hypothetical protein
MPDCHSNAVLDDCLRATLSVLPSAMIRLTTILVTSVAVSTMPAFAGSESTLTLREEVERCDAVVLARWVAATEATEPLRGTTTFEIVEVTRSPSKRHIPGALIIYDRYHPGKLGGLALLTGTTATVTGELSLYRPVDITERSRKYMADAAASATG